jgi:hypothetical protein
MAMVAEITGGPAPWFTLPRILMGPFAAAIDVFNRLRRKTPLVEGSQINLSARDMYFDGGKAGRELGFPTLPARMAVEEAWAWYREHGTL